MYSLNILSKPQINEVQDVSQKIMLHSPNSITKAVFGLFKHNGNHAWFTRALG